MKEDSLSEKAYTELRRKILSSQLLAGSRLKEDEWSKKLEVNRMALREALTRLLGEQMITKGERGGFFIKSITAEDLKETRELREILELGALRLSISRISKEEISELERICDDFTSMYERGYLGGACEADMKFHETLMEYSGNEKLKSMYMNSNIPLFHQKLGQSQTSMDDYELTDREHRQLVAALKSGDLHSAEETLIKHLDRGEISATDLL